MILYTRASQISSRFGVAGVITHEWLTPWACGVMLGHDALHLFQLFAQLRSEICFISHIGPKLYFELVSLPAAFSLLYI